jgi:3-oxoacyl-[acyl-carrier-protein] synthase II
MPDPATSRASAGGLAPVDWPGPAITGVGLVTPLGHSAWSTWRALLDGRAIHDRAANYGEQTDPFDLARGVGAVAVARHVSDDPAIELAERAARGAAHEAGADPRGLTCVLAASKGAVADLTRVPRGPLQRIADALADRMGLRCGRQIVAACASSLIGLHIARGLLRSGEVDRVLLVSAEAAIQPAFVHSYRRLGVLPSMTPGGYRARPMDRQRGGFVLTEVGAAVMLERQPVGRALGRVVDTAVASEASDVIRTPEGRPALRRVADRLLAEPIDLLHPHATGTVENDEAELAAYAQVLSAAGHDPAGPDVYACKGALGHGLGTAGLTAVVLATLAGRTGGRPPMPWLTDPVATPLTLRAGGQRGPLNRHAIFAAGFGGHVAGARLQVAD